MLRRERAGLSVMGFGILFVGYLLTFAFSVAEVYFFADVIGGLIMTYALVKLYPHGKKFGLSAAFAAAVSASGLSLAVTYMASPDSAALITALSVVKIAAVMAFHTSLTFAVRDIAEYTGLPELKRAAVRNLVFGAIYFIANTLLTLDLPVLRDAAKYTYFPVIVYGYIWIILNAVLIFRCYMWICLPGDENMEKKPSRIKAVNAVNEKLGSFEDKAFRKPSTRIRDDASDKTVRNNKKKKK